MRKLSSQYYATFMRNVGPITLEEQDKLAGSSVAVIGCGGIGGRAFEMLVRSGAGSITVVDKDCFELSNLNRQAFGSFKVLGKPKVKVAKEFASSVNPSITVNAIRAEFDEKNARRVLKGHDAVVDGLDSIYSRVVLSRTARQLRIPYVFGAAEGAKGISTVFMPNSKDYEDTFVLPSRGRRIDKALKERLKSYQRCESILGSVSNIIGCFEAMQAINILLGKPVVKAPHFLHIDAFAKVPARIGKLFKT